MVLDLLTMKQGLLCTRKSASSTGVNVVITQLAKGFMQTSLCLLLLLFFFVVNLHYNPGIGLQADIKRV